MRRLLYCDVAAAARALQSVAAEERQTLCLRMIREAQCAEAYRRLTGRAHPLWGSGALEEVARQRPLAPDHGFQNRAFCAALRVVLDCVLRTDGMAHTA